MKIVLQRGAKSTVVELPGREGRNGPLTALVDGVVREVDVLEGDQGLLSLIIGGQAYAIDFDRRQVAGAEKVRAYLKHSVVEVEPLDERRARRQLASGFAKEGGAQVVVAPMPGKVVRLLVKVGQAVKTGEGLVVVEAMKMENELRAARDGTVKEIVAREGQAVDGGAKLLVVE